MNESLTDIILSFCAITSWASRRHRLHPHYALLCSCYTFAVLAYRALTGDVPQYLRQFVRVANVPSRHRLRSSTFDELIVPAVRLTSITSRAFPAAGTRIWNTLPLHVTSASSLTVFKQHLKLHLFGFSFPELSPV